MDKINFTSDMASAMNTYLNSDRCSSLRRHFAETAESNLNGWNVNMENEDNVVSLKTFSPKTEQCYVIDFCFTEISNHFCIYGYTFGAGHVTTSAFIELPEFSKALETGDASIFDEVIKKCCSRFIESENVAA